MGDPVGYFTKTTLHRSICMLKFYICFYIYDEMRARGGYDLKKHSLFIPEHVTDNIYSITPFLLAAGGYRGVIFDLDNTVAPYERLRPDEATMNYFAALAKAGIQTALVSNNRRERIELFNEKLGVFTVADAQKPSPHGIRRCIEAFGLPSENVLFVGDQIFTDCLAAHRAGIDCYLVKPIKSKETIFFRLKRALEKPFLSVYRRRKIKSKGCN